MIDPHFCSKELEKDFRVQFITCSTYFFLASTILVRL